MGVADARAAGGDLVEGLEPISWILPRPPIIRAGEAVAADAALEGRLGPAAWDMETGELRPVSFAWRDMHSLLLCDFIGAELWAESMYFWMVSLGLWVWRGLKCRGCTGEKAIWRLGPGLRLVTIPLLIPTPV